MTPNVTDADVAREVMGWRSGTTISNHPIFPAWWWKNGQHVIKCRDWRPLADHNHAHRVIKRMDESGLLTKFVIKVCDLPEWPSEMSLSFTLHLCKWMLTLPCQDICNAAVAVMQEHKAKGTANGKA